MEWSIKLYGEFHVAKEIDNMKNNMLIKKALVFMLGAGALFFVSCKKDFLAPPSNELNLAPETIFNDSARTGQFLANIYANVYNESMQLNGNGWGFCSMTDEVNDPISFDPVNAWIDGSINAQMGAVEGALGGVYTSQYERIRRCNLMLKYQGLMSNFSAAARNNYLGETRFLRAFFYFDLLKRYGGVPIITESINPYFLSDPTEYNNYRNSISRNAFSTTVQFILDDLEAAKTLLPWNPPTDNDRGKATGAAAVALKSRLLLYAASPLFNSPETAAKNDSLIGYTNYLQSRWQLAADAAQEFFTKNTAAGNWYGLYNNYGNLFQDGRVAANKEIIWYRQTFPYSSIYFIPGRPGTSGYFSMPVMANHVELYEMANGKDITDAGSGYNTNLPFVGRDPRLVLNVVKSGDTWKGFAMEIFPGGADYDVRTTSSVFIRKMQPPSGNSGNQKWHYIRLAEIYLNLAEALNEANNGPTAEAYAAVNAVRARATVNMPAYSGLTYAQFKEKLQKERSVELAFENHRFFDLRRWKSPQIKNDIYGLVAATNNTSWSKVLVMKNGFTDKMYLYPFPQTEILKAPNLKQNPGY